MGNTAATLSRIGFEGQRFTNKLAKRTLPFWQGKYGAGRGLNYGVTRSRQYLDEYHGVPPKEVKDDEAASASAYEGEMAPPEAPPPTPPPPTPMPDPGDPFVRATTRRRSIQAQLARRGRLSTILSQGSAEPLGG